ncbi:MAG: hypothetical protein L0Y72_13660 [Gemmataceae bacterium]|nr:hypothetical protein [Gemmataceae bacterium]MCI0740087.1 hypothetical protein [Gemmataceae bacterium]
MRYLILTLSVVGASLILAGSAQAQSFGHRHHSNGGHYHYNPGHYERHWNHSHYVPGHYDYHRGRDYVPYAPSYSPNFSTYGRSYVGPGAGYYQNSTGPAYYPRSGYYAPSSCDY